MIEETLDERRVSAAQKQSFFREVNERIGELSARWSSTEHCVCECLDMACSMPVSVTKAEYERVRADPNLFLVLRGHEVKAVEATVEENDRFLLVRKLGTGATQAAANDPGGGPRRGGRCLMSVAENRRGDAEPGGPQLLFSFDPHDGRARRVEGFLAQVLQRRANQLAFTVRRVDVTRHIALAERLRIVSTPALVVVDERKVRGRLEQPRGCAAISDLLGPWLR